MDPSHCRHKNLKTHRINTIAHTIVAASLSWSFFSSKEHWCWQASVLSCARYKRASSNIACRLKYLTVCNSRKEKAGLHLQISLNWDFRASWKFFSSSVVSCGLLVKWFNSHSFTFKIDKTSSSSEGYSGGRLRIELLRKFWSLQYFGKNHVLGQKM